MISQLKAFKRNGTYNNFVEKVAFVINGVLVNNIFFASIHHGFRSTKW